MHMPQWNEKLLKELFPFNKILTIDGTKTYDDILREQPDKIIMIFQVPIRQSLEKMIKYIYYPDGTMESYDTFNIYSTPPIGGYYNMHILGQEVLNYYIKEYQNKIYDRFK